jgi:hypothetical protein
LFAVRSAALFHLVEIGTDVFSLNVAQGCLVAA